MSGPFLNVQTQSVWVIWYGLNIQTLNVVEEKNEEENTEQSEMKQTLR